jgi:UDP-N-acetylglucosamine 4,6-dehydratase/UDP-glucose 4-epimerase
MFKGKKVIITGGTGSLGKAITKKLLLTDVDTIRIFSRDEWKQVEMQSNFKDKRLRFLIGDVRDKERLRRAMRDVDIVIHTAALKHVSIAEYNPFEAIKTNVMGSQNVVDLCLENNVDVSIAVGTDKAVAPLNTYGATKLLMERIFISANYHKGNHKTKFLCVRYGNVMGSRGSIIPTFLNHIENKKTFSITDPIMTRFNISMNEALDIIWRGIEFGKGGEIFIPKLKAYQLGELIEVMQELTGNKIKTNILKPRQGEKYHESLISNDELRNTYESQNDYILFENLDLEKYHNPQINVIPNTLSEPYSSDKVKLLTKGEIKKAIIEEHLLNNFS